MEALRQGAAQVLEMNLEDLLLLAVGRPGDSTVDILLYDPMPGGSGLLEQLLRRFPEVLDAALELVVQCPSACEAACIDCLWNFRNAYYHAHLDRKLAADRLRAWGSVLVPIHHIPARLPLPLPSNKPVNEAERRLQAMLERVGFHGALPQQVISGAGLGRVARKQCLLALLEDRDLSFESLDLAFDLPELRRSLLGTQSVVAVSIPHQRLDLAPE